MTLAHNRRVPGPLTFAAFGGVLRSAESARLSPALRMALRLCAFTLARTRSVVEAEWREFDLEAEVPTWTIPRRKIKSRDRQHDHNIILSAAIASELLQWQQIAGGTRHVIPSPAGGRQLMQESMEGVCRDALHLKGKPAPDGWRAAFETLARDEGFDGDVVELALDEMNDKDAVRACDRGEKLRQRVKLMGWWGEELTRAQLGAQTTAVRKSEAGVKAGR